MYSILMYSYVATFNNQMQLSMTTRFPLCLTLLHCYPNATPQLLMLIFTWEGPGHNIPLSVPALQSLPFNSKQQQLQKPLAKLSNSLSITHSASKPYLCCSQCGPKCGPWYQSNSQKISLFLVCSSSSIQYCFSWCWHWEPNVQISNAVQIPSTKPCENLSGKPYCLLKF